MPILSVIVPVYNIPENLLANCISSLLAQTLQDIEFFIVNDHSPNPHNALQIKEFAAKDNRIRFIDLPVNSGVSQARNVALKMARGKYIGFVDADDYVASDMYERLVQFAEENDLQCVKCNSRTYLNSSRSTFIDSSTPEQIQEISENDIDYIRVFQIYAYGACDKIYRRELIGDMLFIPGLTNYEDYIFNWEIFSRCKKVGSIEKIGYYNVCRNNSASRSKIDIEKYERIYNSLIRLFEIANGFFDRHPDLSRYLLIYLLNLGLVNREITKNLPPNDGPQARRIAHRHFQQYASLNKRIPGCIRFLLEKRMQHPKNFTVYPICLYYMLKICMKYHTRILVNRAK
ncbi:glycosyltransferase [Alistipes sp.]|uniref:glycosyltransferase n=1 Tax=Alistipes sp. TaxID=1872444 RepID=UPI003AEF2E19